MTTKARLPSLAVAALLCTLGRVDLCQAGNIVGDRTACIDGAPGQLHHREFILNDRSPIYILRGPDVVRGFCAPVVDQHLSGGAVR